MSLSFCQECNIHVEPIIQMTSVGPHEKKLLCPICAKFLGWGKKDKNEGKRGNNKVTVADHGINYCQLCLREKDRLGKFETLDIHHVIEVSDNGADEKENTWVLCTQCHKLTHHLRTYINDHFKL